ncbi:MAG: AMP-binding protein [Pseudomonadota bacterium]
METTYPWTKLYDDAAKAFDSAPEPGERFEEIIQAAAAQRPGAPFLSTSLPNGWSTTLDFAAFDDHSRRIATYLRGALKLSDGAVVAVQGPNAISTVVAMVGVLRAGLVLTNLNPLYTPPEAQRQLADSNAQVLFVSDLFASKLKECLKSTQVKHVVSLSLEDHFSPTKKVALSFLLRRVKRLASALPSDIAQTVQRYSETQLSVPADDAALAAYQASCPETQPALLQYSGGTTGAPKAAQLTLRGLMVNLAQGAHHSPQDAALPDQRILLVLPVYHMFGLYVTALSLKLRYHLILAPSPRPLDNLRKTFERFAPTILPGVNTLFVHLMTLSWFKGHAKNIGITLTGATPLDRAAAKRWLQMTGGRLSESYGLTEATTILTQNPGDDRFREGTVGFPVPGTRIQIKKEDGTWAAPGEPGEVCAKGPQLMVGYAGEDAPQAFDDDGWLLTGDIGQLDEDGYLTLLDRKKDMLIVGGFNVYPNEIETVLSQHPLVSESAVIGVPDDSAGERAYGYVVCSDPTLDVKALMDFCRSSLTAYKCPAGIEIVDALPRSPVGKILRRELRDKYIDEHAS